jgi:nuclear pore complex protein Nup98-Nup96
MTGFGAQPSTLFGGGAPAGGSLFGQPAQQQQQQAQPASGFTFGQTNNTTSTPFGQQAQAKPTGFGGFGASTSTTPASGNAFGGFGASQQSAATPFGGGASTFGAKPAGGLFGQPAATSFGQPQQTGGLFGAAGALGVSQVAPMPTQGTLNPPYDLKPQPEGSPDTPYDHDKKTPQLLNYTSITCMKPYRGASLEELRLQDYEQGRKTGNGGANAVGGFGQSTSGFGAPAQTGGLFGQQQQTPAPAFGGGGLFGQSNQQQPQQTGGLFGSTNNASTGLFGQQQQQPQTGGGLFGQPATTQPASTGFGFGATPQTNNTGGFSFGQNNTQQQNKPAGGLFGGFGATTTPAAPATSGFSFGGASTQPQAGATTGFGGSTTGGFGFGANAANNNAPKPGGLFGAPAASTAPTFGGFGAPAPAPGQTDNKPAFSFGGGGFGSTGQQNTAAPSGGLFGATQPTTTSQPSTGFSFGGASNNTAASGTTGGLFGGQQNQQSTGFGGASGGLFGSKPAAGGLFGQPQQQQQAQQPSTTGGFGFGAPNTASTGGGLFGAKPAAATGGLFGSLGGANNQTQTTGGGLFGNNQNNTNTLGSSTGGGLFGNNQAGQSGGGGLFGSTNQQSTNANTGGGLFGSSTLGQSTGAGFSFGGQSTTQPQLSSSLFGSTQSNQQTSNLNMSLNSNPYGTDALFGGQAGAATGSGLGASVNNGLNSQPHLPFNVSLSRSTAKKQPPLVPPFRPSSGNSIRITKLRGSTPGLRESTPGREGTPTASNSLFSSSPAPPSSYQRLSSPSPSIFRGLSDDLPRSQREGSTPAAPLPPQAFVSRPSVKRLVLDDGNRSTTMGLGRSGSLFSFRGSTVTRDASVTPGFDREGTPGRSTINFSPALETAASSRANRTMEGDSSFNSTLFSNRRPVEETPSKAVGGAEAGDTSLPALNRSIGKQSKEDALLPLDYWTTPALSELRDWSHAELQAVEGFVVGRKNVGTVTFDAPVDLTTVGELSNIPGGIVIMRSKECIVYPLEEHLLEDDTGREKDGVQPGFEMRKVPGGKAKEGEGLNQPATVRLLKCWPIDRSTREPIKDENHIRYKQQINKLKRRADIEFVSFEADSGAWTFRVQHFSRYGLDETDEDGSEEDSPIKKGKPTVTDGGKTKKDPTGKRNDSNDDDDDDAAPPTRALGESTDEDGSEEDMDMRGTPRRDDRQRTPKATGLAAIREATPTSSRNSVAASNMSTQPWAASLGLEARRVQVMQASFFGGSKEAAAPMKSTTKQSRMASPSFTSSHIGAVSSRQNFSTAAPVASQANDVTMAAKENIDNFAPALASAATARPRKFTRLDMTSSVVDGGHGIVIDAGLSMGRSFRVGWGPDGCFAHSGKWLGSVSAAHIATSARCV